MQKNTHESTHMRAYIWAHIYIYRYMRPPAEAKMRVHLLRPHEICTSRSCPSHENHTSSCTCHEKCCARREICTSRFAKYCSCHEICTSKSSFDSVDLKRLYTSIYYFRMTWDVETNMETHTFPSQLPCPLCVRVV